MVPLQQFATGVLAEVIRRQPASAARTAFAWQLAVGPAFARASTVNLRDGVLTIHPRDARWRLEIRRAETTIVARLQELLGANSITRIEIL